MNLRMRRAGVVFGDAEYNPGGTCGPRTQADYQLVILQEGTLELLLDHQSIRVEQGHAILLRPRRREFFCFTPNSRTLHSWCAIEPGAVPKELRRAFRSASGPFVWTPHLQRLFEFGKECGGFAAEDGVLEAQRFVHLALLLLSECMVEMRRQSGAVTDRRLEKMRRFIVTNYRQPLTLAELSHAAGLSKQHLLKICRRAGNPSPLNQLSAHRLQCAADLLLHTGLSIKEISEQSGFENPFHFSRKFKGWSGVPPRDYRERTRVKRL